MLLAGSGCLRVWVQAASHRIERLLRPDTISFGSSPGSSRPEAKGDSFPYRGAKGAGGDEGRSIYQAELGRGNSRHANLRFLSIGVEVLKDT